MDDLKTLKDIRSAGGWFVGEYAAIVDEHYEQLENDKGYKAEFIKKIYLEGGRDSEIGGTRTRVNALMRIIERKQIVNALEYVIESSRIKKNDFNAVQVAKQTLKQFK